ncbi:MAG: HD-GYP domain-containing protein [Patescibacteria group bacterium]|nr:HD-GYP domain-containing protein [Patescibacteria group bacterium]
MLTVDSAIQASSTHVATSQAAGAGSQLDALIRQGFGRALGWIDGTTGEVLAHPPDEPMRDWGLLAEMCREVAKRGKPEFLDDEDPFLTLALPLRSDNRVLVAVGTFVGRRVALREKVGRAAEGLGWDPQTASLWAGRQEPWPAAALERTAQLVLRHRESQLRIGSLEAETASLAANLASTYEEISLLYRLTQNLKISEGDEELGQVALEWLAEVLPAKGLAMYLVALREPTDGLASHGARTQPVLLTHGERIVELEQFDGLIDSVRPSISGQPTVLNHIMATRPDWPVPQVRQAVLTPLSEGGNLFGWLAAFNHTDDAEFGTVEASLLSSVATILGIHGGNIDLYRQQAELLTGVVRALTSAIDAKDPYTCGHSDRVARIAVRLADELGMTGETLNTIYLAGLLHDIGKIGVDDEVLRKPGKLTDAEYEHIKRHPEIGHKILRDLGKLDEVLPVVLHHHESWDGQGYPRNLGAATIPLSARIVAVADSFDAMGSDRPYRQGMPSAKIDAIFKAGAGQQWDPEVVDAFFRARADIDVIANSEQLDVLAGLTQYSRP